MELNAISFLKLSSSLLGRLEGFDSVFLNKKFNLTIKDKFLIFLLDGEKSPSKLIELLGIAKTNLALISKELLNENLIRKQKDFLDKRLINYALTESGEQKANKFVEELNKNIKNSLEFKNKNDEINKLIVELLKLLG